MSLRNISVRARNLLGFGLLGLILLVTGGVALKRRLPTDVLTYLFAGLLVAVAVLLVVE